MAMNNLEGLDVGAAMTGPEAVRELCLLWGEEFSQFEEGAHSGILPNTSIEYSAEPSFDFDFDLDSAQRERTKTWSISFSSGFRKAISGVDKKLQGRVLEAISELTVSPDLIQGDTRKPLVGKLKGWWRYRIGDYRLVYEPNVSARVVVCHDFAARGGIYE